MYPGSYGNAVFELFNGFLPNMQFQQAGLLSGGLEVQSCSSYQGNIDYSLVKLLA